MKKANGVLRTFFVVALLCAPTGAHAGGLEGHGGDVAQAGDDNIYYLTAAHLTAPIPLFRTSVKFDSNGILDEGYVARPTQLQTDRVKMLLFANDYFLVDGTGLRVHRATTEDPHMMVRQSNGDPWQAATFDDRTRLDFTPDFQIANLTWNLNSGLPPWHWYVAGGELSGTVSSFYLESSPVFGLQNGKLILADGTEVAVTQVMFDWTQFTGHLDGAVAIWGPKGAPVRLVPDGHSGKLSFNSDIIYFSSKGTALGGALSSGTATVDGVDFDIGGYGIWFHDGVVQASVAKVIPSDYSGVQVLWSETAALKMCQAAGISAFNRGGTRDKDVNFSGEKTFYDYDQGKLVTLKSGQADVFSQLMCQPKEADSMTWMDVPFSAIHQ